MNTIEELQRPNNWRFFHADIIGCWFDVIFISAGGQAYRMFKVSYKIDGLSFGDRTTMSLTEVKHIPTGIVVWNSSLGGKESFDIKYPYGTYHLVVERMVPMFGAWIYLMEL